ncbi:MAG: DNA topoisomerase 3 [Bdellovibrionota bacterium]
MSVVVIAEKPSVAKDIADVLGVKQWHRGYYQNSAYKISWAFGHLVGIAQPHEINSAWKVWKRESLPMLPTSWPLRINEATNEQFKVIESLLADPDVDYAVCATDAGREGELIFRYIYEKCQARCPVKRLWISSLTEQAIRNGFNNLLPWDEFANLADAARARSRADWLVGMNLSRAYSMTFDEQFSVGRVQTPTLSMIVDREREIESFQVEEYLEIQGSFFQDKNECSRDADDHYVGVLYDSINKTNRKLKPDALDAQEILENLKQQKFVIDKVESKKIEIQPPLLFDLTELQRRANRLYGYSAQKTLEIAQQLYENKKLITYPRTDSKYLSDDIQGSLESIVEEIIIPYQSILRADTGKTPLGKRYINQDKITDHHAIIPTGNIPQNLNREQSLVYEMICRRLLCAWQDNYVYTTTTVMTRTDVYESLVKEAYEFRSKGKVILQVGWKNLEDFKDKKSSIPELPDFITQGVRVWGREFSTVEKKTSPPPRFTDASLLTAMESAGSCLDDKELSKAMREKGLGTPATRSAIIETLIQRQYIARESKSFVALEKGSKLIELVHSEVKSPKMTGEWEHCLARIEKGEESLAEFSEKIEDYLRGIITKISQIPIKIRPKALQGVRTNSSKDSGLNEYAITSNQKNFRKETKISDLRELLKRTFGFDKFRPGQEEVCRDVVKGNDSVLVMPTGAGKSLCYQLPGLARGGTTLIISPLIALMEDQVYKLNKSNLEAECLHSGLDRQTSRNICIKYLNGSLDFLFVAPERFAIPGFVSMLCKRMPSLIAIDEAHCISQWGHDFRPDYRMLKDRLQPLRPTPIIATTATATPRVQRDIIDQLGLTTPKVHARGFRRTNIMIEAVEISKSKRLDACKKMLLNSDRLPAIVYAPTRKQAEEFASQLSDIRTNSERRLIALPYHAGLSAERRAKIQKQFIEGNIDVVVATVAFGMGVDKADVRTVIHLAVPSSIEAYYQEIGRAGRDGKLSRAILLFSYADLRTHEFFYNKNYPTSSELEKVAKSIGAKGCHRESVRALYDLRELENCLDKLWVHGGIKFDENEYVYSVDYDWKSSYEAQRTHIAEQMEEVSRFAQNQSGCRMLQLMAHFADRDANGTPCGICDVCAPELNILKIPREPTTQEIDDLKKILSFLSIEVPVTSSSVFRETFEIEKRSRMEFEAYVNILVREGFVRIKHKSFHKDGRDIQFKLLSLTSKDFDEKEISAIKFTDLALETEKRLKKSSRSGATKVDIQGYDQELFHALKKWRLEESRKSKLPAFRVLGDRTLQEIALRKPQSEDQLLQINGIGSAKYKKFGKKILHLISLN